jgi:hypothetical protein
MSNSENENLNQNEFLINILPSVNYIIDNYQKHIRDNDLKINHKLRKLIVKFDDKLKLTCHNSYNYLVDNELICNKIDDNTDEFALFLFEFINIKHDNEKYANEFIECITNLSADANDFIDMMNKKEENIIDEFKKCKNNCIYAKIKKGEADETRIISCLDNCFKKVGEMHNKYTEDYISNINSKLI